MNERGKRAWMIWSEEYDTEAEFRAAVENELVGLENIGHRMGGGFVVSPVRERIQSQAGEEFVTIAWRFENVFVPAVSRREPVAEPELAEEPALVEERAPEPVGAE
jgi:hypothetical protein